MKKRVLFICTHNSLRSQMAEGLVNNLYSDRYETYSRGTEQSKVNPYAVKVMSDIGIDISYYKSKSIESFKNKKFDIVVTVCDSTKERCPFSPGSKIIHKSFEDHSKAKGTESEITKKT